MRYRHDPANPRVADWSRADAKTDEEIIADAMSDPDCPPATEERLARFVRGPHLRILRARLGLTLEQFSERYGIPLEMARTWDTGVPKLDPAARALLTVIWREPEMAAKALAKPELVEG
jgi:putative transcriptional regulator